MTPAIYATGAVLVAAFAWGGVQTVRLANCQRDAAIVGAAHATQIAAAIGAAATAKVERDSTSETIGDTARAETQAAVAVAQRETSAASERVRVEIRRIEVPGACPATLPPVVESEGRAAVERANAVRR